MHCTRTHTCTHARTHTRMHTHSLLAVNFLQVKAFWPSTHKACVIHFSGSGETQGKWTQATAPFHLNRIGTISLPLTPGGSLVINRSKQRCGLLMIVVNIVAGCSDGESEPRVIWLPDSGYHSVLYRGCSCLSP